MCRPRRKEEDKDSARALRHRRRPRFPFAPSHTACICNADTLDLFALHPDETNTLLSFPHTSPDSLTPTFLISLPITCRYKHSASPFFPPHAALNSAIPTLWTASPFILTIQALCVSFRSPTRRPTPQCRHSALFALQLDDTNTLRLLSSPPTPPDSLTPTLLISSLSFIMARHALCASFLSHSDLPTASPRHKHRRCSSATRWRWPRRGPSPSARRSPASPSTVG